MRTLLRLGRDKSALSNVVAYVLLIVITLALSVLVYAWLRFYVNGESVESCPDGVNLVIRSYKCFSGEDGNISLILKNKGRFTINGYTLRVHDRGDANFGFYIFDNNGRVIKPGEEETVFYEFVNYDVKDGGPLDNITFADVQPYIKKGADRLSCKSYAFQEIECHEEEVV